jgi:NADH:ubiquinone oxidoreductase subunit K
MFLPHDDLFLLAMNVFIVWPVYSCLRRLCFISVDLIPVVSCAAAETAVNLAAELRIFKQVNRFKVPRYLSFPGVKFG